MMSWSIGSSLVIGHWFVSSGAHPEGVFPADPDLEPTEEGRRSCSGESRVVRGDGRVHVCQVF